MPTPSQKPVIWTIVIATIIILIANLASTGYLGNIISQNTEAIEGLNVSVSTSDIVKGVVAGIVLPETPDTFYSVSDYKDSLAEELATAELSDDDFKEMLMDAMNDDSEINIEDEDDITDIAVSDIDVSGAGSSRDVEFTLKVRYFNDGDDDEEDLEKAKVKLTYEVTDLNRNDDYEDAEADEEFTDFELVKIYD